MAPPLTTTTTTADAFLSLTAKRQGAIKGECKVPGHVDEIQLVSWEWGLSAPTALGSGQATGRRVYEALVVRKHIDAASTKLMNALATNDELKSVKLALRKSGMEKDDFMTIELQAARAISLHIDFTSDGSALEVVKIAFQKVEVTYHAQTTAGGRGGALTFSDDITAGA